ncbi:ATP-binding protein [Ectobacillus sp. JY-23]|uniref:sensor histidine kinase n=1 Tax=Ectobacillus sp. JY-23 TaxID=2933872 RepID=UPI001FF520C0|nr:HAMP domain-containing sensor histidine kinase [Ectobacillus sp. JY-23]UOY91657.1 ATP-binding protein [Ectobacillus sp. JY-23]
MKGFRVESKVYWLLVVCMIVLMLGGLLMNQTGTPEHIFYTHAFFVMAICGLLLIYPYRRTSATKLVIGFTTVGYFYVLFLVYPETPLNIILIAFAPGIAILFFHRLLFYTLASLNIVCSLLVFWYIGSVDLGHRYGYVYDDLSGNMISFLGSQVMLMFIFILMENRVKKMEGYYRRLQQTERLQTVGQLAAAVAHEMRNPITVVNGFLQLHREDIRIPNDVHNHMELMLTELHTAERVLDDFLALSKPEVGDAECVNVREALYGVTDLLASYALIHNVSFAIEMEEQLSIRCSKVELKQLLVNILKNAIESMPEGGVIRLSADRNTNGVRIRVADSGVGMSEEELKLLGTPFYSLKSRGTGLGLMICFNIIEKYRGSIYFTSKLDVGTTVTLQFPIEKGAKYED